MFFFWYQTNLELLVTHQLLKLRTVFAVVVNDHGLFFELGVFGIFLPLEVGFLGPLPITEGVVDFVV